MSCNSGITSVFPSRILGDQRWHSMVARILVERQSAVYVPDGLVEDDASAVLNLQNQDIHVLRPRKSLSVLWGIQSRFFDVRRQRALPGLRPGFGSDCLLSI